MLEPLNLTKLPFEVETYMTQMPGGGYPKVHIRATRDLAPEDRFVSAKRGGRGIPLGTALCMRAHKRVQPVADGTKFCHACEWEARHIISEKAQADKRAAASK